MAHYRVVINDKPSQTLSLDPDQPLADQLKQRLKLHKNAVISYKVRKNNGFEPLYQFDTLRQLDVDPNSLLYISTPRAGVPIVLILAGIAVLAAALIFLLPPLRGRFVAQLPEVNTTFVAAVTSTATNTPEQTMTTAEATASSPPAAPPTTTAAPTDVAPVATTSALIDPTPPAESVAPSPAASTPEPSPPPADPNSIEIAVGVPGHSLTSDWQLKAEAIGKSAQLALDDNKGLLTIPNLAIKIGVYNEDGSDASVRSVAGQIAANPNTLCVVGHYNSGASNAAKTVYQGQSLTMITPSSSAVGVTDIQHTIWRLVGNDKDQGVFGARFAAEVLPGVTQAFVVYDASAPNTTDVAIAFRDQFSADQQRSADPQRFIGAEVESKRFAEIIQALQNRIQAERRPHIIYFAGRLAYARIFLEELREAGITDIPILGIDTFDSPELVNEPFLSFSTVYATTMAQPLDFGQGREYAQKFATAYQVPQPTIPGYSAEAYDATTLCIEAIANAAQAAQAKPNREQVLQAMRNLTGSKLASKPARRLYSGPYEFKQPGQGTPGDLTTAAFYVRQLVGGEIKTTHRWNREARRWEQVS